MLWSTSANDAYAEAICYSDNGEIDGNWLQLKEPLFAERPVLKEIIENGDGFLKLK